MLSHYKFKSKYQFSEGSILQTQIKRVKEQEINTMNTQSNSLKTKTDRYRFNKRKNEIETYKQHVRKQMVFRNTLNQMVTNIPTKEVAEVEAWSRHFYDLLSAFQMQKKICFAEARAVQLFLMVKRFPNLFTLKTLKEALKMFTVQAIHQITALQSPFAFFEQVLKHPEDYVKRSINQGNFEISSFEIETQIVKQVLEIISLMWAKSDATRNFTLNFGQPINRYVKAMLTYKEENLLNPFLKILSASTNFSWGKNLHPQYKLILNNLFFFLKKFSQVENFKHLLKNDIFFTRNIFEVVKSLCKLYQMKEAWILKIIEEQQNLETLTHAIQFHLSYCIIIGSFSQSSTIEQQYFCHPQNLKYIGQVTCQLEDLIIEIQQKTVKDIRNINSILKLLLDLMKVSSRKSNVQIRYDRFSHQHLQIYKKIQLLNPSRKKAYFIISNFLCENQHWNGDFQCKTKRHVDFLIYQCNLIDTLSQNILIQTDEATIYDLIYLIGSIVNNILSLSQSSSFLNSNAYKSILNSNKFQDYGYGYSRQHLLSEMFQHQKIQIIHKLGPSRECLIFLINSSKLIQNTFERIIQDDSIQEECKVLFFGCIQNYLKEQSNDYKNKQVFLDWYNHGLPNFNLKIEAICQFKQRLQAYAVSPKCTKNISENIGKCLDLID